jgi:Tol biopolymer transport system component
MHAFLLLAAAAMAAPAAELTGTIRLTTDAKVLEYRPDGKLLKETPHQAEEVERQLSPNGKETLFWKEGAIYVADKAGRDARQVSPKMMRCATPLWSPDGSEIAFQGRVGENYQLHVVKRDGTDARQLTEWGDGVEQIAYAPDGKLFYLRPNAEVRKFTPAALMVYDGRDHQPLVKETFISDYAWSPDGKWLVYGTLHKLVFIDVAKEKETEVPLATISELFFHHAANTIAWSPDSKAIACRIPAYVSRAATFGGQQPPKDFGDSELFVIPREGKATWFVVGDVRGTLEWTK